MTPTIPAEPWVLSYGPHPGREGQCAREALHRLVTGEVRDAAPECACPVLAAVLPPINDAYGDDDEDDARRTAALWPVVLALVDTRGTTEDERRRSLALADLAVRRWAPAALDIAYLPDHAATLRALKPVVDCETAWGASKAAAAADAAAAAATARSARRDTLDACAADVLALVLDERRRTGLA